MGPTADTENDGYRERNRNNPVYLMAQLLSFRLMEDGNSPYKERRRSISMAVNQGDIRELYECEQDVIRYLARHYGTPEFYPIVSYMDVAVKRHIDFQTKAGLDV